MKRTKILATVLMASLMLSFGCDDGVKEETEYIDPNGHVIHHYPGFWIYWFPSFHGYSTRTVYIHQNSSGVTTRSYTPPAKSVSTSRGGWGLSSYSSGS